MRPAHHMDYSSLISYSAGAMPEAFAVVAATHLSVCRHCRENLLDADRMGAALIAQQEPFAMRHSARDALMERINALAPEIPKSKVHETDDVDAMPAPLRPYFGDSYRNLRWRFVAPGIHRVNSHEQVAGGSLMLLRVAAGKCIPEHSHGGNEMTCILKGAYDDMLGHFGPGDLADLDSEACHQPITSPGAPCICVAATDAPLQFKGWLARTLQPLFSL